MKILFLGANGLDTSRLRLPAELRDVKDEIERAKDRADIEVHAELAVRPVDLSRLLLDQRPDVVHFSGHGMQLQVRAGPASGRTREFDESDDPLIVENAAAESAILLESHQGTSASVSTEALTGLFAILKSQRCVVLNACFSSAQAKAIATHVDCVIGMKRAIQDESAIAFSVGFYRALARGLTVKKAFELGKNTINICNCPDADVPELHCREGVDPDQVRFLGAPKGLAADDSAGKTITGAGLAPAEVPPPAARRKPWRVMAGLFATWFVIAVVWLVAPLRLPMMGPAKGVIVVVGPGFFAAPGRSATDALCSTLHDVSRDGEPLVVCRNRGMGDDDEILRAKAIDAGASVLVAVNETGVAQVYPLKDLAKHDLVARGLPSIEVFRAGAAEALSPLLRELARVADKRPIDETRLRCNESVADDALGIAIVTMFLKIGATNCFPFEGDAEKLEPRCLNDECKKLLAPFMADKPAPVEEDERAQLKALRKNGLSACENGDTAAAMQVLKGLTDVALPVQSMMATEIAACLSVHGNGLTDTVKTELRVVAKRDDPECDILYRARIIGARAGYWAEGKDWKSAEEDYAHSWDLQKDYEALLGRVEVRLHRFKEISPDELVKKTLEDVGKLEADAKPGQKVRAKLFVWVAEKRRGNGTYIDSAVESVVAAYSAMPTDADPAYDRAKPDAVERGLLCLASAKECRIYDLLAVPRDADSAKSLREALRAAVLPE